MSQPADREACDVTHDAFTIERVYAASPAKLFHALTDPEAKARWFAASSADYRLVEREMDVRPGGREHVKGRWDNGKESTFDAVYFDVVANARLVYAYEMTMNGQKISVSLASMTITPHGDGARLVVTEQGTFLDGYDDAGSREHGTRFLLEQLGKSIGG